MPVYKEGASSSGIQENVDDIQDLLIKVKAKLNDDSFASGSLADELYQVAVLAENFTAQRPRSNKNWSQLADTLDREGVNLWNMSGLIRQGTDVDSRTVVAALRLAGFRLVEAGLEKSPGIETLLHVLQMASKTGAMLSALGDKNRAASVLTCAAKFEESLRNAEDPEGLHQRAKARATIVYYSSRMEAAWKEGNDGVASYMLQKITDHDQRLAHLPPCDRELLAAKFLEIGKSTLKGQTGGTVAIGDESKAQDAVRWMQKAYYVIEQLDDSVTPSNAELKRAILRSLARAYFISSSQDSENLTRAEAALQELIASIDSTADQASAEYQQLRWMRLAVLKRRKSTGPELLLAFKSIINHMRFTEVEVTDILQELRTLGNQHDLVSAVHIHCLQYALSHPDNSGFAFVDRFLLSLIFHCSKDDDHARCMKELGLAFKCIVDADFELSKVSTTACLTLIWQYGDRHYHAKKWMEAADWFRAGSHPIFQSMGCSSSSKCLRKTALCYIQRREYAQAASEMRHCATNEATTQYVLLLIAVHQGIEDEAIKAARDMVQAPDFDRKMLLLATQLARESDMKGLLLAVLDALLQTLNFQEGNNITEAMILIRCSIRLILKLLTEPAANQLVLVDTLLEHFVTAAALVEAASVEQKSTIVTKDISWLWRTAYNCAVQGCSDWENTESQVTGLFQVAAELLIVYCDVTLVELEVGVHMHVVNASFAATSGRVFATRQHFSSGSLENGQLQVITKDIQLCKQRILDIVKNNKVTAEEVSRAQSFIHVLRIFETEMLCHLKDWNSLKQTITEAIRSDALVVMTFEAIADILWSEKDCPVDVLFSALEALLHASLDRSSLSVEKFSRWLRAICTILLSRNTAADRLKAVGYVEQAFAVMDASGDDPCEINEFYPVDERQWLLGTSYNTGIECLHASFLDEAKRWFEASAVICKFVPDGQVRAKKISETYTRLLACYS